MSDASSRTLPSRTVPGRAVSRPQTGDSLPRGALPPVRIEGVAFWATRLPGWDLASAVMRGEMRVPDVDHPRPAPLMLAPNERRRAPDAVALALEVASRACEASGRSGAALPAVFASTHGDLVISDYMCSTLASTPSLISPIRFHNSVHNASAGYWSIGTGSHAPYTAISAYGATFGMGLLEAVTQVACGGEPVLYVAFDVAAKGPLATMAPSDGLLGVGLVLAPSRVRCEDHGKNRSAPRDSLRSGPAQHRRVSVRVQSGSAAATLQITPARSDAAAVLAVNALAPCLSFFEALACGDEASLTLALGRQAILCVALGNG